MSFDLLDETSRLYRYVRHLDRHGTKLRHKASARQPVELVLSEGAPSGADLSAPYPCHSRWDADLHRLDSGGVAGILSTASPEGHS